MVRGPVFGDDDAVPVGDYHFPHTVSWNLAGEPRGDDARMLELLEPYRPQRGRVLRLLGLAGKRAPAFGPTTTDPADVPMVSTLDHSVADAGATVASPAESSRNEWRRAVAVGIGAFVVSRLIVLFGAYTRAAQVVTDRQSRGNPFPQSTRPMIEAIFTQWDGKWYRMIAENGYPSELPERITYITGNGATVAFFPVYPILARWFDVVFPGGIVHALLGVNVVLSVAAVVLVGLLARDLYGVADRPAGDGAVRPVPRLGRAVVVVRRGGAHRLRRGVPAVPAARAVAARRRRRGDRHGDAPERHRHRRRLRRRRGDRHLPAAPVALAASRRPGAGRRARLPRLPRASTPVSGGRGTAPSGRPGTRAGAGGRRRSASPGASSRTRSAPPTGRPTCTPPSPLAMLGFGLFCSSGSGCRGR